MTESLITLTSDIVAAHLSNNNVAIDEVPVLIEAVFGSLANLGPSANSEPAREPAVSIRASVSPDQVVCLDCGRKMKVLKRHLSTDHGLTAREYRARWNLPADHPLVAPNYANRRRTLAKKIGLGRKPGQKPGRKKAS
jgi:predicted transcriptional regulator